MQVSVFVGLSLDGFLAREDHSLDYLKPFEAEEHGYAAFMATIDTLVIGRATYDVVLGFDPWPYAGKRVVVLTHRPLEPRHGETVHHGALAPLLARLEAEGTKRVYLDGGIAVRQGLDEGVVDDLTLSTVPVLIGAGRPLFGGGRPQTQRWELLSIERYPSGLVQARYRRARA